MFRDMLHELLALAGAEYCCVADPARGTVLEEGGSPGTGGPAFSLTALGWAAAADGLLTTEGDGLDDLILTSPKAYHLVRRASLDSGAPLLIYLRLGRSRATLAVALRALATARPGERSQPPGDGGPAVGAAVVPAQRLRRGGASGGSAPPAAPVATPVTHPVARPVVRSTEARAPARPVPAPGPQPAPPPAPPPSPARGAGPVALPRRRPVAVPRPRPAPAARVPVAAAPAAVAGPSPGGWRNDMSTLERVLKALRAL